MPARRFNKSTAVKYRLLDICAAVCGCALAAALVFYVIFSPFFITESGLCDFVAGDCVLADRVGKYVFGFSRGDSVIYKTGNKLSHTREIGRIVAFAGERFTVRGGLIYIDNKLLDESDYAVPFDSEIDLSELIPRAARRSFRVGTAVGAGIHHSPQPHNRRNSAAALSFERNCRFLLNRGFGCLHGIKGHLA